MSIDLAKAYVKLNIAKLFEILDGKAESHKEKHLVNLLKAFYTNRKIVVEQESLKPTKGCM